MKKEVIYWYGPFDVRKHHLDYDAREKFNRENGPDRSISFYTPKQDFITQLRYIEKFEEGEEVPEPAKEFLDIINEEWGMEKHELRMTIEKVEERNNAGGGYEKTETV